MTLGIEIRYRNYIENFGKNLIPVIATKKFFRKHQTKNIEYVIKKFSIFNLFLLCICHVNSIFKFIYQFNIMTLII